MADDIIDIEILSNGTLKVETDRISGPNHLQAENLLTELAKAQGGKVTKKRKAGWKPHSHGTSTHIHQH